MLQRNIYAFYYKIPTLRAKVSTFFMSKTSFSTGQGAKAFIASHHVVAGTRFPFVRTAPIIQQRMLKHAQAFATLEILQPNSVIQTSSMSVHRGPQTERIRSISGPFMRIGSDFVGTWSLFYLF